MRCEKCGIKINNGESIAVNVEGIPSIGMTEGIKRKASILGSWNLQWCTECFGKLYQQMIDWLM